jgi:hypothetical protein
MTTKGMYLIGMLALLFLANIAMLMGMTNWPQRTREGFAAAVVAGKKPASASGVKPALKPAGGMMKGSKEGFATLGSGVAAEPMDNIAPYAGLGWASKMPQAGAFVKHPRSGSNAVEGFMDTLTNGFATAPIGSYDGVNMAAALQNVPGAQGFRARLPNEPLAGPPVEIGPDNLFYFKNNQCKPECCGATLSCDGGCVCTTPEQRDFINQRGGNRKHDDGF